MIRSRTHLTMSTPTVLTLNIVFPEEFNASSAVLTLSKIWPDEPIALINHRPDPLEVQDIRFKIDGSCQRKIPKPNGEVTRLSRGGYSLQAALRWDKAFYYEVQVSIRQVNRSWNSLTLTACIRRDMCSLRQNWTSLPVDPCHCRTNTLWILFVRT